MKIQESDSQFRITIPKAIVKAKGWDKGTELEPKFDEEGRLVFEEKEV